ncbi:hypothetical protein [Hydrogenophaga sp. T2]|uniref:hypothetical protein n=1 Tax=Hydrogenophaga sp. T2 TaxID=3132823 RepID=UPI003CE7858D
MGTPELTYRAARSLDARFASVELIAERSWSNIEIARAVRELREGFRAYCEICSGPGTPAPMLEWAQMPALKEKPPHPATYLETTQ